jgi:transcriptional regulator with XRE-family HTH domain
LERGLEQRDAAARLGVRPATYGRWERGQKRPAIQLMPRILTLLGPGSFETQTALPEARLLSARQLLGLSQAGLAEKLGVDRGTVGDWERGVRLPAVTSHGDDPGILTTLIPAPGSRPIA